MKNIGFTRLDTAIFHIFITHSNEFKVIDTARAMKKKSICPNILLKDLKSLGYDKFFLSYVKENEIELYNKWGVNI